MLSVIVAARAGKDSTLQCMQSILYSLQSFPDPLEYVLVDDHSDPIHEIQPIFQGFRKSVRSPVKVFRARMHRHYTAGLGFALSQATGDAVLFLSNDMMVTSDYVAALLKVAAKDPSLGILRGTAPYVDSHPDHQLCSPLPLRNYRDICGFSHFLGQYFDDYHVEDRLLCGDAMLIKRAVIQRIGVTDRRYFGYFGDIDYGLRAQRAGFKLACAKGAWLHHTGAISLRWETDRQSTGGD